MAAPAPQFKGWLALAPDAAEGKLEFLHYEPKPWEENDVDIKITHCGVCGSDVHMMRSGWVSEMICLTLATGG
jgi:D-arabinose 1-dehydrogenase-like Zn-dependent alcohol dehydrogenase